MKIRLIIIFWAYYNVIRDWLDLLDPKKREIFNNRLNICKRCSFKDELNLCSICKCPIKPKSRGDYDLDEDGKSLLGCPKKYW
jgi:hypothetical protein